MSVSGGSSDGGVGKSPKKNGSVFEIFRFPPRDQVHLPSIGRVVQIVGFVLVVMLLFSVMMHFVDTFFMAIYKTVHA